MMPGRKYCVSIRYKNSVAGKYLRFYLGDSTASTRLQSNGTWAASPNYFTLPNSTSWATWALNFTTPATYHEYSLTLVGREEAASSSIYLDNASIQSRDTSAFFITNLWDGGTLTASSEATNFPAINTRHRWHKKPWCSTGTASEWLKLDLGSAQAITAFIVRKHNIRSTGDIYIAANSADSWAPAAFLTAVYDTGAGMPTSMHSTDYAVYLWDTAQVYEWWRMTTHDSGNPDGFLSFGRIYLGTKFEPERDFQEEGGGWVETADPSIIQTSENGQVSTIQREHYRTFSVHYQRLSINGVMQFRDMFAALGSSKALFYCNDMGDPWNEMVYVRVTSPLKITQYPQSLYTVEFTMEELR
jgi:hypothetical protein